jgi:hypothetical protein
VLRWEYRPGATVYIAWTQTRANTGDDGALSPNRDGRALLGAAPVNAVVVKATYRFAK